MPVQPGTHVPNTHVHVSNVPHIRVIMRIQDVHTCNIVNSYKACGHTATIRLQCDVIIMDHSTYTATVSSDTTA
jgi:hypothetical protein